MNAIKRLRGTEPVRLYAYPFLLLVILAGATAAGVTQDVTAVIPSVLALLLGVPAAEAARAKVTPPAKVQDLVSEGAQVMAQVAIGQVRAEAEQRFGWPGRQAVDLIATQVDAYVGRHRRT